MPTRPSRRTRGKRCSDVTDDPRFFSEASHWNEKEARLLQSPQLDVPHSALHSTAGMPTPFDCAVDLQGAYDDIGPACHELEVGPMPDGVRAGEVVNIEFLGATYDVIVPEGCGPGSYFRASLPTYLVDMGHTEICREDLVHDDRAEACGLSYLNDGIGDRSDWEDPIWNADWAANRFQTVFEPVAMDAECCLEMSTDCCVEEQPDNIDYLDCMELNTKYSGEPRLDYVEVFGLTDVSTWFTRLRQRREQALRAGKTKLVRKIDREMDFELEKSRQQGPIGPQAAFCNGQFDEVPSGTDDVWDEDWANFLVVGGA